MAEASRTTIFSARAQNDQKRRFRCQFNFACLKMARTFALLIQKDRGTGPMTSWQPSKQGANSRCYPQTDERQAAHSLVSF